MVRFSKISNTELEYLKTIIECGGITTITELSRRLKRAPSTVYEEVNHLASKGLVRKDESGISITDDGKAVVELVTNSHRIIETWLHDLGFSVEEACRLAKVLQNVMPLEVVEKLYERMGKPSKCPHGNPISFSEDKQSNPS